MDADHSGLCRFDPTNRTDKDNLERVLSSVEDLYQLAVEKGESLALPSVPQDSLESRLQALVGK